VAQGQKAPEKGLNHRKGYTKEFICINKMRGFEKCLGSLNCRRTIGDRNKMGGKEGTTSGAEQGAVMAFETKLEIHSEKSIATATPLSTKLEEVGYLRVPGPS
jgi:hypothetical protein